MEIENLILLTENIKDFYRDMKFKSPHLTERKYRWKGRFLHLISF